MFGGDPTSLWYSNWLLDPTGITLGVTGSHGIYPKRSLILHIVEIAVTSHDNERTEEPKGVGFWIIRVLDVRKDVRQHITDIL